MVRHTGENFVDEEGIAIAPVLALQSADINCTEFDTEPAPGPAPLYADSINIGQFIWSTQWVVA